MNTQDVPFNSHLKVPTLLSSCWGYTLRLPETENISPWKFQCLELKIHFRCLERILLRLFSGDFCVAGWDWPCGWLFTERKPWDDSSPFFKHQHFFSELFPTIEQSNLSLTLIDQRGKFTDVFFWGKKKEKIHRIARVQAEEPSIFAFLQLGVSKNRGTPKWMVYNGKPYFWMDDLGGKHPLFFGNIQRTPSWSSVEKIAKQFAVVISAWRPWRRCGQIVEAGQWVNLLSFSRSLDGGSEWWFLVMKNVPFQNDQKMSQIQ